MHAVFPIGFLNAVTKYCGGLARLQRLAMPVALAVALAVFSGCANSPLSLQNPQVKVVSLAPLASQGMQRRFAVGLEISNPNAVDILLRGMSYDIDIGGYDIFSGVAGNIPTLKAYTQTPVVVEVSANIVQVVRLISDLTRAGPENLQYRLSAKLDVGSWLPAIRVVETGPVPFINARSLSGTAD